MKKYERIFKRVMCIGIVAVLLTLLLTGCVKETYSTAQLANPFEIIEGKEIEGLVYNSESKTVYVMFSEMIIGGFSYGYLSEYVINGHNCEYRDGKIVEVIPNYKIVGDMIVEVEPTYKDVKIDIVTESVDDKWNSLTEEEKEALLKDK